MRTERERRDRSRRHRNATRPAYVVRYERQLVEGLLLAIWNGGVLVNETAPDEGLPRAKADPSHLGSVVVGMIDVSRALDKTGTKQSEKALYLHYAQGWTYAHVAAELGVARSTATDLINEAVSAILTYLNGTPEAEEEAT